MKRNDILWKAVLEDLFDDFLRFFYPNANKLFDMERGFEYLDKELDQLFPPEGDQYAPRYVDKLVKVFTNAAPKSGYWCTLKCRPTRIRIFQNECFNIIIGYLINTTDQ